MIEAPPVLTIRSNLRRPSEAQITAFQGLQTGFVVDALFGGGALSPDIQPVGGGRDLTCVAAGPALTADNGPADILATHAALKFIRAGDILVAAHDGYTGCATVGDSVMGMLRNSGAAGFVSDGPVRDYDGIVRAGLPVWCTGLTPASPHMSGPGSVGYPVQIGGQQVDSGDMVVADRDGVVVVPFERIDEVIERLDRIQKLEDLREAEVAGGMTAPAWVDEFLASDKTVYRD